MYLSFQLIKIEGTSSSHFQAVGCSITVKVRFVHVLLISVHTDFRKNVRYYEILGNMLEIQSIIESAQLCLCHVRLKKMLQRV